MGRRSTSTVPVEWEIRQHWSSVRLRQQARSSCRKDVRQRTAGHTGGTIDKLESFHGFHTSLTPEQFIKNVNSIHIALAGQTANLAPADKKIYALRDVTGTVDQMSLIASAS